MDKSIKHIYHELLLGAIVYSFKEVPGKLIELRFKLIRGDGNICISSQVDCIKNKWHNNWSRHFDNSPYAYLM